MKVINAAFTGNTKSYAYVASEAELLGRQPGDRIVVPNKLKEDGSLGLTIVTYLGVQEGGNPEGLTPIVQFIDASNIRAAKMLMLEAANAQATAA